MKEYTYMHAHSWKRRHQGAIGLLYKNPIHGQLESLKERGEGRREKNIEKNNG